MTGIHSIAQIKRFPKMISVLLKVNKKKTFSKLNQTLTKKKQIVILPFFGNMTMTKRDMTV